MISEERKKELIDAEVMACDGVLAKYAKPEGVDYLRCTTREFVEHCFENKAALIEQLGGWRWHGNVVLPEIPPDAREVEHVYRQVYHKHTNFSERSEVEFYDNCEWPKQLTQKIAQEKMVIRLCNMAKMPLFDKHGLWCSCEKCKPFKTWTADQNNEERERCGYHILVSVRKGQSIARATLARLTALKMSDEVMAMWNELFEALGQLWAASGEQWGASLSIAPSSFLRLGHYNEGGSCYRFGGERMDSKGILAQMPRSFVGMFYQNPEEAPVGDGARHGKVNGRCWGQLGCAERPGLLMSNVYKITKTRALKALEGVVKDMFKVDEVQSVAMHETCHHDALADSDTVYVNGDGFAISISEDVDWLPKWIVAQNRQVVIEESWVGGRGECHGCDKRGEDMSQCANCGNQFCNNCSFYDEQESCTYCTDCASPQNCTESSCYVQGSTVSMQELADGRYACSDHVGECVTCNEMYLQSKLAACKECGEPVCESCLLDCEKCGDVFCDGCLGEHEEACKERDKEEVKKVKKIVVPPAVEYEFKLIQFASPSDVVDGCFCNYCTQVRAATLQPAE